MTASRIRACGESALLIDCPDLAHSVALARNLELLRPAPLDVVPAARTVLVSAPHATALPGLRRQVEEVLAGGVAAQAFQLGGTVTLGVRYDGPDLSSVAELMGVSVEALVRAHTQVTWRAAFGGFAPGFCYLVDERELDDGAVAGRAMGGGAGSGASAGAGVVSDPGPVFPAVPRLSTPRTRVPVGAVGLADRFCAVYPGASPGGWRLLGTTDAVLWDADRERPALVAPGDVVRFRAVDERSGRGHGPGGPEATR